MKFFRLVYKIFLKIKNFFLKFLFSIDLFYFKKFCKNHKANLYDCKIYILTHGDKERLKYLKFFFNNLNVTYIKKKDEKFYFYLKKKIILNNKFSKKKINSFLLIF